MVNNKALAEYVKELGFDQYLRYIPHKDGRAPHFNMYAACFEGNNNSVYPSIQGI